MVVCFSHLFSIFRFSFQHTWDLDGLIWVPGMGFFKVTVVTYKQGSKGEVSWSNIPQMGDRQLRTLKKRQQKTNHLKSTLWFFLNDYRMEFWKTKNLFGMVEIKTGNSLKWMKSYILKAYGNLNLKWLKNVKYYKLVFKMLVNIIYVFNFVK